MCNCRNTYPLSVQLRMAAVREAINAHASALVTGPSAAGEIARPDIVATAAEFEAFMRGNFTKEQLDKTKMSAMDQAHRAQLVHELMNINVIDMSDHSQKALADWITGYKTA